MSSGNSSKSKQRYSYDYVDMANKDLENKSQSELPDYSLVRAGYYPDSRYSSLQNMHNPFIKNQNENANSKEKHNENSPTINNNSQKQKHSNNKNNINNSQKQKHNNNKNNINNSQKEKHINNNNNINRRPAKTPSTINNNTIVVEVTEIKEKNQQQSKESNKNNPSNLIKAEPLDEQSTQVQLGCGNNDSSSVNNIFNVQSADDFRNTLKLIHCGGITNEYVFNALNKDLQEIKQTHDQLSNNVSTLSNYSLIQYHNSRTWLFLDFFDNLLSVILFLFCVIINVQILKNVFVILFLFCHKVAQIFVSLHRILFFLLLFCALFLLVNLQNLRGNDRNVNQI